MTEKLLQFIWQYRFYNASELRLYSGEELRVLQTGRWNSHQGPDFTEARIRINDTTWVGQVELHCRSSDWFRHEHQVDPNYSNVILHVVWENDLPEDRGGLPMLVLADRVPKMLLSQFEEWTHLSRFIPCESQVGHVDPLILVKWKERLLASRLMRKADEIRLRLQLNNHHWEETCWWLLAHTFGSAVNAESFEAMARSLSLSLLLRYRSVPVRLEALLMGQSGLLGGKFEDDYPRLLKQEYEYLAKKHGLKPVLQPLHLLRMRPENFPTLRLSQLAGLLIRWDQILPRLLAAEIPSDLDFWLNLQASDYWDYHYLFDKASGYRPKRLGQGMIQNILINAVIPVYFAYGIIQQQPRFVRKAADWLEQLEPEKNTILDRFHQLGINCRHAGDSQALMELKKQYCDNRRCLDCSVGHALLKNTLPAPGKSSV